MDANFFCIYHFKYSTTEEMNALGNAQVLQPSDRGATQLASTKCKLNFDTIESP